MEEQIEKPKTPGLSIPQAIIIGCFIIALAIFAGLSSKNPKNDTVKNENKSAIKEIPLPNEKDHIKGSLSSPIVIVEYSDTECPFCKVFHTTMKSTISKYEGKVAWVYRHMPIESLHAKARNEANATECVAALGGEEAFWTYLDKIFEITTSNDGLDESLLPKLAKDLGIDEASFKTCLDSKKYDDKIGESISEAENAGIRGTPTSFIIKDGKIVTEIPGAQPQEKIEEVINQILK